MTMDKQRIEGGLKKATGTIKEKAGQVTGDRDLEAEGTVEKGEGHIRSGIGKAKDRWKLGFSATMNWSGSCKFSEFRSSNAGCCSFVPHAISLKIEDRDQPYPARAGGIPGAMRGQASHAGRTGQPSARIRGTRWIRG